MRKSRARHRCPRCSRNLLPSEFRPNPKLAGGRDPWCESCIAARTTPSAKEAYRRAYQKAYHAKRNESKPAARPRWKVRLPGGVAVVTLIRRLGVVEARCTWGRKMHAMELLESLGASEIELHGRGGGRGRRRKHARALVVGTCDVAAAERVLDKMQLASRR